MPKKYTILHYHGSASPHGGPQRMIKLMMQSSLCDSYNMHVCEPQMNGVRGTVATVWAIRKAIQKYQPDLIHVRGLMLHGFRGVVAGRICRTKTLLSIHGSMRDSINIPLWKKALIQHIVEPLSLWFADDIFSVCHAMNNRRFLSKYSRKNRGVVHNGIPICNVMMPDDSVLEKLKIPKGSVIAFCACRLVVDKGIHVLLDAFDIVAGLRNNIYLVIAGDGPYMKCAQSRTASARSGERVRLIGHQDDVSKYHAISSFFVMPTLHENLSNVLLEAMLASKAIITTSVGGNAEIVIDHITGLLIPPSDAETLAQSMLYMCDNPEICMQFGLNGRKRVEDHFSFDAYVEKMNRIYQEILR